jgi:hypothetical protein
MDNKEDYKKKVLYILLDIDVDPQTEGVSYDDITEAVEKIIELFDKTK